MRGIILAGGSGTRLYPLTRSISKQILPVYDKPMIFYPLSTLMLGGIRDILLISTPRDIKIYQDLLGDGSDFGINISYKIQPSPDGLVQAFLLGEDFIGNEPCAMILGDNIFYGPFLENKLKNAIDNSYMGRATVFGIPVPDPNRFGIIETDSEGKVLSIEEKPEKPKSNICVTGLYFYDCHVCEYAKQVKPSQRGELEITDLNRIYLENGNLDANILDSEYVWMDMGTIDSLLEASVFVRDKSRTELIMSPEAIAYRKGWISSEKLLSIADRYGKSQYGAKLKLLCEDD